MEADKRLNVLLETSVRLLTNASEKHLHLHHRETNIDYKAKQTWGFGLHIHYNGAT